ncbi:MAG: DUF4089 domain-containing protein [Geminicoccaceae bacterium]
MTDWDPDRHIDALAPLLGLEVTAEQRPGVRRFLEVAHAMAQRVEAAVLPDALHLAPVFRPVDPRRHDRDR